MQNISINMSEGAMGRLLVRPSVKQGGSKNSKLINLFQKHSLRLSHSMSDFLDILYYANTIK